MHEKVATRLNKKSFLERLPEELRNVLPRANVPLRVCLKEVPFASVRGGWRNVVVRGAWLDWTRAWAPVARALTSSFLNLPQQT